MRRILAIPALVALFLLVACSTEADAQILDLHTTLYEHEAILEAIPVELNPLVIDALTEYLVASGFEPRDAIIYRIRYISDAYEVIGYVAAPIDYFDHKYPILIYNRGGNTEMIGMLTPEEVAMIAMGGYIVLASQYRGVAGGTGVEQFGGDDINDVLKLIDISEDFDFARQGGVYMFGGSRGGMMTYIASRLDDRIVAAAVWAAPTNLLEHFHERQSFYQHVLITRIGGTPDELPDEYIRRSAIFWANEIMAPILIGHGGGADYRVATHHATNMAEALERYGIPHRLSLHLQAGHDVIGTGFLHEVDEWFRQHPITD